MHHVIELFVMQGCAVCPQMEKIFHSLHQSGAIQKLNIVDVAEQPQLAEQYNIRSVPYYLINGIAFTGLKSRHDIMEILGQDDDQKLQVWIAEKLGEGSLDEVEHKLTHDTDSRLAMMTLLEDSDTELVVRIGLSAVIETLAPSGFLNHLEARFIELAEHPEERIAIDALYYLHLLSTPESLKKLTQILHQDNPVLQQQARELLQESSANQVLH